MTPLPPVWVLVTAPISGGEGGGRLITLTYASLLYQVPIHYLDQSIHFPELCALYYRADVMVITSLRDGMNLVSFEFLACQSKKVCIFIHQFI